MKKIATVLIYVDDDAQPDQVNRGNGLACHGDSNYVLTINPNEHASFWLSGITAGALTKMKTIIAHELGHLLGFLCGDKYHAEGKKVTQVEDARIAYELIKANQIGMEYEAWRNAYMIGPTPVFDQIKEAAMKSYKRAARRGDLIDNGEPQS